MLRITHGSGFIITPCTITYAQITVFRFSLIVRRSKTRGFGQMDTASPSTDLQESTVIVEHEVIT